MKKIIRLFVVVMFALLVAVGVTSTAQAGAFYAGSEDGDAKLPASKTVDGSAYMGGSRVVVEGTVNGDLYCFGEKITINGTINGDVICAGASVTIGGTVNGDVRVGGADVTLEGVVTGNAFVGGANVTSKEAFTLEGDMTVGADQLVLDGMFGRDVLAGASTATLDGTFGRDVSTSVEQLIVDDKAVVAGNLWYKSTSSIQIPETVVAGETTFQKAQAADTTGTVVRGVILSTLGLVFMAIVGVLVMPRFVHTAAMLSPRDTMLAFLIGMVTVIIVPIVALVFAITMVGLYVSLALMVAWLFALIASVVFVSYYVGSLILRKRATNAVLVAVVGALALSIAMLIPFINALVVIVTVFTGVGMQVAHLKYQFSKDPYKIA
jgi:cytoskeletal protein CcmA (bactofilin family)